MPSPARPRAQRRGSRADARRAEARRRGRQRVDAEAGADPQDGAPEARVDASAGTQPRPSLLQRLLPRAAPLAGKPDPLARFSHRGPALLRGPAEAAYLLTRNPLAWMTPAMGLTLSQLLLATPAAFLSTTLEFGSLIVAGALGWQRPWLFGAAAAVLGSWLFGAFVVTLMAAGRFSPPGTMVELATALFVFRPLLAALLGAVAGWFGGYWRRRFAEASELRRRQQRRDPKARG